MIYSWLTCGASQIAKEGHLYFYMGDVLKVGEVYFSFLLTHPSGGLLMLACFSRGENPQMETVQKSKQARKLLDLYVFLFLLCGINDEIWVPQILKGSTISPTS